MAKNLTLQSPWVTFEHKLRALFGEDPDVNILFDEKKNIIKMYVADTAKAEAIAQIVPEEVTFGNIVLHIIVVPPNATLAAQPAEVFSIAFKGNPAVSYVQPVEGIFFQGGVYVVFANKVVQFFNDDLTDIHGNWSGLYEDIARELLVAPNNVFFCTDIPESNKVQG